MATKRRAATATVAAQVKTPEPITDTRSEDEPVVVDARRAASTQWVTLGDMRVTPSAQRKFQSRHAQAMADDFDLEAFGYPVINFRDGVPYIVDGQHRVAALRLMNWGDEQKIECEVYHGLTEAQEADLFLRRDNRKNVHSGDKYRIAVNAGYEVETAIEKISRELGITVGLGSSYDVQATGSLKVVYNDHGPSVLGRTLLVLQTAYPGGEGYKAEIIKGLALVIRRHGMGVDTKRLVHGLQAKQPGGALGLDQKANGIKRSTGVSKQNAIATAVVEAYNKTRGKRLPDWFKENAA